MVFLVDHHADGFAVGNTNAAGPLAFRQFPRNELPLDQKLPVERFELSDIEVRLGRSERNLLHDAAQLAFDLAADPFISPAEKGVPRQIAGQSDATGHDDIRVRSASPQPFSASPRQIAQLHSRRSQTG